MLLVVTAIPIVVMILLLYVIVKAQRRSLKKYRMCRHARSFVV